MKKFIIYIIFFLFLNACYRIPQREEIEYRNNLENALVETFPKKVIIVIHPFKNLSPSDTNRAYLENAIPDSIEAMLEPIRSTLAYIPFEGMPFYVSQEISNLFQTVETNEDDTNSTDDDEDDDKEDDDKDEDDKDEDDDDDEEDDENNTQDANDSYFTYLTNYLLVVPIQETQYNALTTTNTNYYNIITNAGFENGQSVTNFTSNEILITTTNEIRTNIAIINKNILTPTNMLLLLYEEFPELTNYLSFLPIEIRRATTNDIESFKDYKLQIDNPAQWRRQQIQKEREALNLAKESNTTTPAVQASEYPTDEFEYFYHISGTFRTRAAQSIIQPVQTDILMQIYPPESTGNAWWKERHDTSPPSLSNILSLVATIDPSNTQEFKDNFIRTPFTKPDVSPRLQDEFNTYSTNFRDSRPETPARDLTIKNRPLSLRINVSEDEIPMAMTEWLKYFHATIVNRPYTVLKISSTPNNALVYLNGFFIGITPFIYPTVPIGQQRILFLKDGFNREEILVDIIPKQTNNIFYSMQSLNNSGTLALTASIPEAEIYVNSQYKGKTPLIISNLSLDTKYRIEILDPSANLTSNRNSVYKDFTLTSQKPSITFDAHFKTYETTYRSPAQQGLLAATYISWFTTIGLFGSSIFAHARSREAQALVSQFGTPTSPLEETTLQGYQDDVLYYSVVSDATLYSAIAAAILSTGIMGWYLYSKEVYLGMDIDPEKNEWYVNFKLKF